MDIATTKRLEVLDILANGYTVVAVRDGGDGAQVILATDGREYATWVALGRDKTFWGHYHGTNIEESVTDFKLRAA